MIVTGLEVEEKACWCWIRGMRVLQGWKDCKGIVE